MSSWWSVIHGYNNQRLNEAIKTQLDQMSHVMFGGLTHEPAIKLGQKLIEITPKELTKVFFADSGSISVEVALKMALQYWHQKGEKNKTKFVTPFGGYHGDTFGAMSVCDPDNGMHSIFSGVLPKHFFAERPTLIIRTKRLMISRQLSKSITMKSQRLFLSRLYRAQAG